MSVGERTITACAMFGLVPTASSRPAVADVDLQRVIALRDRHNGGVAYVTGPSGSGKSALAGEVASQWPGPVIRPPKRMADVPIAELSRSEPLERWLGTLARAGLAEARLRPRLPPLVVDVRGGSPREAWKAGAPSLASLVRAGAGTPTKAAC